MLFFIFIGLIAIWVPCAMIMNIAFNMFNIGKEESRKKLIIIWSIIVTILIFGIMIGVYLLVKSI